MLQTVSNILVSGVGGAVLPYFLARVATGLFFVFSGYHKLTNAGRRDTFVATLQACDIPSHSGDAVVCPTALRFLGGLAVAFGILTPLAALGLATICIIAAYTDGIRRVRKLECNRQDRCDRRKHSLPAGSALCRAVGLVRRRRRGTLQPRCHLEPGILIAWLPLATRARWCRSCLRTRADDFCATAYAAQTKVVLFRTPRIVDAERRLEHPKKTEYQFASEERAIGEIRRCGASMHVSSLASLSGND